MVIAWTFLSGASDRFRAELGVDRGTCWALWKALISLVGYLERDAPEAALARRDIEQVLADHAAEGRVRVPVRRRRAPEPQDAGQRDRAAGLVGAVFVS